MTDRRRYPAPDLERRSRSRPAWIGKPLLLTMIAFALACLTAAPHRAPVQLDPGTASYGIAPAWTCWHPERGLTHFCTAYTNERR